jgi:hypothetical protein
VSCRQFVAFLLLAKREIAAWFLKTPIQYSRLVVEDEDYKVFLANTGRDLKEHAAHHNKRYSADWIGQFVPSGYTQEQCAYWVPMHSWSFERMLLWAKAGSDYLTRADSLVDNVVETFAGAVPDADSLQRALEGGRSQCGCREEPANLPHPDWIVETAKRMIDEFFPSKEFAGMKAPQAEYKNESMPEAIAVEVPMRVVSGLICCGLACEEANRADVWHRAAYRMKGKPKRAGCRFAQGVYLYRRYTQASIEQIATVLRIPTWE